MAHSQQEALSPKGMEGHCGVTVPMVQGEAQRSKAATIQSTIEPGQLSQPPMAPKIDRNPPPTP